MSTPLSDEACAIILMHYTIKSLNKFISGEIQARYGANANYPQSFIEIGKGFGIGNQNYLERLAKSYRDHQSLYRAFQPETLYEYNKYLSNVILALRADRRSSVMDCAGFAYHATNPHTPKFYSSYAPDKTISSSDLFRGFQYMVRLITSLHEIDASQVQINQAIEVILEREQLEANRQALANRKRLPSISVEAQQKAAAACGGTELINPFSLDNLQTADCKLEPESKAKEK